MTGGMVWSAVVLVDTSGVDDEKVAMLLLLLSAVEESVEELFVNLFSKRYGS